MIFKLSAIGKLYNHQGMKNTQQNCSHVPQRNQICISLRRFSQFSAKGKSFFFLFIPMKDFMLYVWTTHCWFKPWLWQFLVPRLYFFSCSTQLSTKFKLLIKLTYRQMKNSLRCYMYHVNKCWNENNCWVELSSAWKKFYDLEAWSFSWPFLSFIVFLT